MSSRAFNLLGLGMLLTMLFDSAHSQPAGDWQRPLIVDQHSRVVAMEYEAWFGPNAVTFQNSVASPWLRSPDMVPVGGGYDSADPAVIQQHVKWLETLGIDAALVDLSNNVSCIFDSEWFVKKYLQNFGSCPTLRSDYQVIRDNTGNLYAAWSRLHTHLKIIPVLGGIDENALYLDEDGKTAFEKEINYFGERMAKYPQLSVIYEGKPLMLVFLGAGQDPAKEDNPLWLQLRHFLTEHPEIAGKYTFRQIAGYIESQPDLWRNPAEVAAPHEVSSEYRFWSWVDRLKPVCSDPACPYYPSYNREGIRVENLTAAIATAGQAGWGCPNPDQAPYCEDDSLRWGENHRYATFSSFMEYARKLDPIFLIIHQFNEFMMPDEGFDAATEDDIEPSNLWGTTALDAVSAEVERYHRGGCVLTGPVPLNGASVCRSERSSETP